MSKDSHKLTTICDSLSDLVLGNADSWQDMDFDDFVQMCRNQILSRNQNGQKKYILQYTEGDSFSDEHKVKLKTFIGVKTTLENLCNLPVPVVPIEIIDGTLYIESPYAY